MARAQPCHAREARAEELRMGFEQYIMQRADAAARGQQRQAKLHVQQVQAMPAPQRRQLPAEAPRAGARRHADRLCIAERELRMCAAQRLRIGQEEQEIEIGRAHDGLAVQADQMTAAALVDAVEGVEIDAEPRPG